MTKPKVSISADHRIIFHPLPWWVAWADCFMRPIMYWLQADYRSLPQETHYWNNQKFHKGELAWLSQNQMVAVSGDRRATRRRWLGIIPIFHIPRFGGWKRFIVIQPAMVRNQVWYVGWQDDVVGLSLLPVRGPVRVLLGPNPVSFFGIGDHGAQISITKVGEGTIGDYCYHDVPLR